MSESAGGTAVRCDKCGYEYPNPTQATAEPRTPCPKCGETTGLLIECVVMDSAQILDTARIEIRHYITSQHLWTARREAWLCRNREDQLLNDGNVDQRHRSHAITAVLSAVAFLEAFINAIWQDAADSEPGKHTHYTDGIPDDAMATMRELWNGKDQAERMMSLLSKFQVALVCAGHERIDEGAEPFQSADVLVDLRDELVHFKPRWHSNEDDTKFEKRFKRFEKGLKSKITPQRENRQPIGLPWFPNKALGAGCADWACESSIAFARTWHQRTGLTHDFDNTYLRSSPPVQIDD